MKTRERIVNAAITVFAMKGRYGAHIEDIAALAHINKAMIYYIFQDKDELYLEVLKFVFSEAAASLSQIECIDLKTRNDYIKFISDYITKQIMFFNSNRIFTKIMVDAMSNGAEEIRFAIQYYKKNNNNKSINSQLKAVIDKGIAEGFIRDVDIDHFITSVIGMITIYFQSQSMTAALDIEIKEEDAFLEKRKESIVDLIIHSIVLAPDNKKTNKKSKLQ